MTIWMSFLKDRPQCKTAVIGTISSVESNKRHLWMLCPPTTNRIPFISIIFGRKQIFQNLQQTHELMPLDWSEETWCLSKSEPRRRDIVQPSLVWERVWTDAHCWVCKQVTSTHCEGWINTPSPPLFSLHPHLLPFNLRPQRNPSASPHPRPPAGWWHCWTLHPLSSYPACLPPSLLCPSTCL